MTICAHCGHDNPDDLVSCERCHGIMTMSLQVQSPLGASMDGKKTLPSAAFSPDMVRGTVVYNETSRTVDTKDFDEASSHEGPYESLSVGSLLEEGSVDAAGVGFSLAGGDAGGVDASGDLLLAEQLQAHTPRDPLIGREVNGFRFVEKIGKGGFGAVYRATQLGAQLPVAIKVLHLHQVDNAEVVRRFQREARALSQLRHPQIVKMIDFGMLPQFGFYLVMEFLRGATLYERLRTREVFPIRRLIPLFRGLCDVLRFVHEKGIVHRDLKLSNIYLTEEHGIEKVTLLDFGIAAVADDIDMITKTGAYIGTATYASPEQAMGMKELDGRSDLYALAILLYRLLVGRPPFEGLNSMEITHRKLSEAPPTLASMVPHRMWTPQLEAFFQTALSREPEGRPHDASVFWEHCHKALVAQMELDRQGDSTLKDAPKTEVSQRVPIEQLSGGKPGSAAVGARESVGASISIQQSGKLHTLDFTEGDSVAISPEELLVSGATQEWQGPQEVLDAIVAAQPQHEEESSSKATISTSSLSFVSTEELDSFAGDVPAVTAPEGLLLAEAVARSAGDAGATLDEGLAMSTRREKGLDAEAFDDQTLVSEEVSGQGQVDEAFADQTHADAIVGRVARSRFEGARTQLTEMTFSPTLADGTGDELSITAPPVSSAPVANNGSEKSDGSAWSWMVGGGIVLAVALAILLFWVL